jgi:hypothetical protein
MLCYPLQIIVGMELHHKPWLEVYQKVRLSKWMVSNKLSATCYASSKLLKLSLVIRRCNENKKKFQIKYECPQELSYYQAKNPNAYIWQLDSPQKVCCNVKYQYSKICHAFTLLLQEKTRPKIL